MPRAYSNDLRRKFFQAYDAGDRNLAEVAERFRVSVGWAKKISARRRRTGEVEAAVRQRAGRVSQVTAAVRDWIREQVRQQPDVSFEELRQRLERAPRLRLSVGWLWAVVVRQLGLRLKKSRSTPPSRTARRRSGGGKRGGPRSARSRLSDWSFWTRAGPPPR